MLVKGAWRPLITMLNVEEGYLDILKQWWKQFIRTAQPVKLCNQKTSWATIATGEHISSCFSVKPGEVYVTLTNALTYWIHNIPREEYIEYQKLNPA